MNKYSVGLGITSLCNMNCSFCYSKDKRDFHDKPITEWKNFFDINNMFIENINFGTGENSLLEDWYWLVDYIKKRYPIIKQAVTTNGSLIEQIRNDIKKIKIIKSGISEIDISIDYGEENKHNSFRGNINAFSNAIKTLDFCNKSDIQPTIVVMGIDDNINPKNMSKIFNIARTYKAFVRINLYRPVRKNCTLNPPEFQKIIELLNYIDDNEVIVSLSDPLFCSIFTQHETHKDPSCWSSIRILPNGDIFPSTYLVDDNFKLGNISEKNVLKNLSDNDIIKNFLCHELPNECKKCSKAERCNGGTLDRRYLWYNTLQERDPYCSERYEERIVLKLYENDKNGFSSIHDGYLPTLFFKPRVSSKG